MDFTSIAEVLLDYCVERLKQFINAANDVKANPERAAVFSTLHNFEVLNTTCKQLARSCVTLAPTLLYERTHALPRTGHAYQCFPSSLVLRTAAMEAFVRSGNYHEKRLEDLVKDLDKLSREDRLRLSAVTDATGVTRTVELPPKVQSILLLDRAVKCYFLMDNDDVQQCWNGGCKRVFNCCPSTVRRFCTVGCRNEYGFHLAKLAPCMGLSAEPKTAKVGLSRIAQAFAAAMRRNVDFEAAMQKSIKTIRASGTPVVRKRHLISELQTTIDVLNVDVGLLYWSKLIASCSTYAKRVDVLPGESAGWRRRGCCVDVRLQLDHLYRQSKKTRSSSTGLIVDVARSQFLSAIRSNPLQFL